MHEAYLDISARKGISFPDRARFMGYAARVMRGIIIDHARSRGAQKRSADFDITSLEGDVLDNASLTSEIIVTCGQSVDNVETSALNRRVALTSPSVYAAQSSF